MHNRQYLGRVPAVRAPLVLRLKFALLLPVKMGVRTAQMLIPARRDESAQRLNGYWKAFRECVVGVRAAGKRA